MSNTCVTLKPVPGFCIKSAALQPGLYTPPSAAVKPKPGLLEPESGPIPVPIGLKIFINIAWDPNVPPPPAGSEEAIQQAMKGEDLDVDDLNPDGWYVPVIVSEGRQDKDKAGNPSLVFDCIYHTSVKSRTLTDPEFKIFLVELALQRLEAQTSLVLSRQIGTPNISSKGKLLPRTVLIPSFLAGKPQHSNSKPLIEEVTHASTSASPTSPSPRKPRGILKANPLQGSSPLAKSTTSRHEKLTWAWSKIDDRLRIVISVPALITSDIAQATLDIEPRRFIVSIPDYPTLDVNLVLSDAEIVATSSSKTSVSLHGTPDEEVQEPNQILMLKRQRDLDVDSATAEWHVAEGNLVLLA